jgi:hypothetical protein
VVTVTALVFAHHHGADWWWLLPIAVTALLAASVTHEMRARSR